MVRLKAVLVIILIVILSFSVMETVPAAEALEPLDRAMETTGAKLEQYNIHAWVKLPSAQYQDDQLESIAERVMSQLEVAPEQCKITRIQTVRQKMVQIEAITSTAHIVTIAQVVSKGRNQLEPEGYLVINIDQNIAESAPIRPMQGKIATIAQENGPFPEISTCLIGYLDGKLSVGEWHGLLQHAFMVIDATIIDWLETENFVSCTGFTSKINNWVQSGGKKINFNMAMRYNQYNQRTYVTIGSPIITREY